MAFIAIPDGGLFIPPLNTHNATTALLIDDTTEKYAIEFMVPVSGVIDTFGVTLGTVTQAPTNGLKFSLQDVSGVNGNPDGVVDQYRVVTSVITSNSWLESGLITHNGTDGGTKRTVTAGQRLAAVIEFESFTAGDSLNFLTGTSTATVLAEALGLNFGNQFTIGSWIKTLNHPLFALKYATLGYVNIAGCYPYASLVTTSFAANSTPDERGITIEFPFVVKVRGGWFAVNALAGSRDFACVLYDDENTVLSTTTVDSDWMQSTSFNRIMYVPFSSELTLQADTTYRWTLKPATNNNTSVYSSTVSTAAHRAALPWGEKIAHTERTDGGAWTTTTTARTICGLAVSAIEANTVEGGGSSTVYLRRR